ncbi:MAG: hypothetical protein LBM78_01440, partial [Clostridiales bacterium]|nr:hypothetical protein [Clostridiales bacterium]
MSPTISPSRTAVLRALYALPATFALAVFCLLAVGQSVPGGVQYACVALFGCYAAAYALVEHGNYLLIGAFGFTLAAVFFLVLLDAYYLVAVLLFLGAQLFYAAVCHRRLRTFPTRFLHIFARIFVLALLWTAVLPVAARAGGGALLPLAAAAAAYLSTLVCNFCFALPAEKAHPLFGVGLLLFIGCDVT